jgi:hypothetical protein
MIRYAARCTDPQQGDFHLIGLGLSDANLEELRKRRPIWVHGDTVGAPGIRILIHWGPTEYELTEEMGKLIGPETVLRPLRPGELPPDHRDYRPTTGEETP